MFLLLMLLLRLFLWLWLGFLVWLFLCLPGGRVVAAGIDAGGGARLIAVGQPNDQSLPVELIAL